MSSIYKDISSVTVNGSNLYLKGYIYDVNFQPSIGKGPSRLSISVVNKDGVYASSQLTVQQASQISIGSIGLSMYPVKYTKKESEQGKTLTIEFVDGSFILDKIYVGLVKKHYLIPKEEYKFSEFNRLTTQFYKPFVLEDNFIILGRELHPCDVNKDGVLGGNEIKSNDPCDPCPNCPTNKHEKKDKCDKLSYLKVFEVAYTFKELIDGANAMASKTNVKFNIEMPKGLDETKIKKYLKNYTGSLKTVLDQWCSDLGLSMAFDSSRSAFLFRDITKDTKLNESAIRGLVKAGDVKIISEDTEESMENTTSRSAMSLYERNGEERNYPCEKSQTVILPIVTDFDFLGISPYSATDAEGSARKLDYRDYSTSVVLNKYSESMREAFWIRNIYKITDSISARSFKSKFEVGKGAMNRLSGFFEGIQRKIPEMGNFTIIQVVEDTGRLGQDGVGKLDKEDKLACQQYNYLLNRISDDLTREAFTKNKGFFVVAYQEKELYEKRLEFEKKVFDSFGRFYLREGFIKLCGITGSPQFISQNTNLFAGEGSTPEFVTRGFDVANLPFVKYPFESTSYLGCLVYPYSDNFGIGGKKGQSDAPPVSPFAKLENSQEEKDSSSPKPYFGPAIICVEREPQWSPKEPDEAGEFKETFEKYKNLSLAEYGAGGKGGVGASAIPASLKEVLRIADKAAEKDNSANPLPGNIKIFTMIPGTFDYYWNYDSESHPTERTAAEKEKDNNKKLEIPGILNTKCSVLEVDSDFKIYAPPLAMLKAPEKGNLDNDNPCDDYIKDRKAALRVLVTQNFTQKKEVPKIQSLQKQVKNPLSDNTFKFELNYLNITNNDFDFLDSTCLPDEKILKKIHEEYNLRATESIRDNSKKITFKLKGIPQLQLKTALELGLEELNFTYGSDGGICTLAFSNNFAVRPSLDLIRAGLAYNNSQSSRAETPTTIR